MKERAIDLERASQCTSPLGLRLRRKTRTSQASPSRVGQIPPLRGAHSPRVLGAPENRMSVLLHTDSKIAADAERARRAIRGGTMARRRYKRGSLFQHGKRQKVWVARCWEDIINADGTMGRMRTGATSQTTTHPWSNGTIGCAFAARKCPNTWCRAGQKLSPV